MTKITREQYKNGLEFMYNNFPCPTTRTRGQCEGCKEDFAALLSEMEIEVEN